MDAKQGSPFHEGRGRGFDMPEREQPAATAKERSIPVEMDLMDLEKPGKGPVNYPLARGRMLPSLTDTRPEGQPEDKIG